MCRKGHGVVRGIFQATASDDLRGFIVWIPMLPGDSVEAAVERSAGFQDRRVVQGWDQERRLGGVFANTLGLTRTAWDVYLVYPPDVTWAGDEPPAPAFWMHQLSAAWGANEELFLDPDALSAAVGDTLGQRRKGASSGP